MSGIVLTGDWKKLGKALAGLAALDLRGIHQELGEAMLDDTMEAFKQGRSPEGQTWPALSARTLKQRRKGKGKVQMLTDSGVLRRSITAIADAEHAEVGTNVVYAAIHQLGGQAGRGKKVTIKARPYLGLGESTHEVEKTVEEQLRRATGL